MTRWMWRLPAVLPKRAGRLWVTLVGQIARGLRDRSGNVAILTAFCALPIVGIVGLGVDYGISVSIKTRLDAAADAAGVSAINLTKTEINAGIPQGQAILDGQAQGLKTFRANAGSVPFGGTAPIPTITIVPSGTQTLNTTVHYRTTTPNQFGKMFNVAYANIQGTTTSNAIVTPYYQFIFVVDISGSMAIGGTSADVTGLMADSRIGCALACHDPYNNRGPDYRAIAKADGWTLKIDYVNQAIGSFIQTLKTQTASVPGVFSVGIDTFATGFNIIQAPTSNLTTAQTSASTIDIEPMMPLSQSQGYTTTSASLTSALNNTTNIGDGSAANAQKTYFIFISDGVEDIPGSLIYGRGTDVAYTSACANMKNAGATVLSIDVDYPYVNDPQYPILVAPLASQLHTAMQACASTPQQYYLATDGPGIKLAAQQSVQGIIQGLTRLTQ